MKHAFKIEELEMPLEIANKYEEVIRHFLYDLGFSNAQMSGFECRRRDGFIPHSYNYGGIEGIAYRDQYGAGADTGFENTDEKLAQYQDQMRSCWIADNKGASPETLVSESMSDADWEALDEYCREGEDTIQFQVRVMLTSETTANVDLYVSCSDSPYHRKSDDKMELEIEFKSPAGMREKLAAILKSDFAKCVRQNLKEAF